LLLAEFGNCWWERAEVGTRTGSGTVTAKCEWILISDSLSAGFCWKGWEQKTIGEQRNLLESSLIAYPNLVYNGPDWSITF
jgi:hypothetical protein